MTRNWLRLKQKKNSGEKWMTFQMECLLCEHPWIAVYPVMGYHMTLECPKCGYNNSVCHEHEDYY